MITYSNSESVKKLLNDLIDRKEYIGIDESHIYINNSNVTFDMELLTELKPIEIHLDDAIKMFKMYKDYLLKYESNKIPGLFPVNKQIKEKWNYISDWKKEGVKPEHIVKWAYIENSYLIEQDEDLIMYRPDLILTMHNLMLDKHSKRKTDLLKILKTYAKESFQRNKDADAIAEFKKILDIKSDERKHLELVILINELENKER